MLTVVRQTNDRRRTPIQSPRYKSTRALTSSSGLTLPSELLLEVLQWLDWRDILRVGQTCKFLLAATESRIIWRRLVNEHSTSVIPPVLERAMDTYTSNELQKLFLLWKSAECGWRTNGTHVPRERTFKGPTVPLECIYLAPGGRWLLFLGYYGALTCYDLDSDSFSKTQLIPDQLGSGECTMAVDHDISSPTLSFTIAVSIRGVFLDSDIPVRQHKLQIWRVNMVLDELRGTTGLEANLLASFYHRPEISRVYKISILGPHVAFVGWKGEECKHYPLRISYDEVLPQVTIHLLSSSRLFVIYSTGGCMLYDYSTSHETFGSSPALSEESFFTELQYWDARFSSSSFSHPSKNTFRLLRLRNLSLSVLTFDDTLPSVPLDFIQIGDIPESILSADAGSPCIGQSVAITVGISHLSFSTYHDTSKSPGLSQQTRSSNDLPFLGRKLFDEQSGRILLIDWERGGADIRVIDIALVYRHNFNISSIY